MPARSGRRRSSGQSLAEFAIVAPVAMALIGAIVQFGIVFWAQNTLTQVTRDTGRWAVTQAACTASAVVTEANTIAGSSALFAYTTNQWSGASATEGVTVTYGAGTCPPTDNTTAVMVTVKIAHVVPVFFPGMQYLPGMGKCSDGSPCQTLSSTAVFRMEPSP